MFYLNLNPWQFFLEDTHIHFTVQPQGLPCYYKGQDFCESIYLVVYAHPPNVHRVTVITCIKSGLPLNVILHRMLCMQYMTLHPSVIHLNT